jgi:hypothetical protein
LRRCQLGRIATLDLYERYELACGLAGGITTVYPVTKLLILVPLPGRMED